MQNSALPSSVVLRSALPPFSRGEFKKTKVNKAPCKHHARGLSAGHVQQVLQVLANLLLKRGVCSLFKAHDSEICASHLYMNSDNRAAPCAGACFAVC